MPRCLSALCRETAAGAAQAHEALAHVEAHNAADEVAAVKVAHEADEVGAVEDEAVAEVKVVDEAGAS